MTLGMTSNINLRAKTILLVGSGGREHALAWKLAQSPQVKRLIIAPGNDGMSSDWERWKIPPVKSSFQELAKRACEEKVDLAIIGPDNPLAEGIVDVLESHGILTMGPRAQAAQIEASKSFAKDVMRAAGVPTAQYWVANTEEEAHKILKSVPWPIPNQGKSNGWVVKADGLALGKGVRVCEAYEDAMAAAKELISLSGKLLIEEKLMGEELSWMAICDGERCALLEPARDYKRLKDHDQGPNTGGMGSMSPVPNVPAGFAEKIRNEVFLPVLREMKRRGAEFRGILYAGLMADFETEKYWVLEFNARFGDPETQVLIPRIEGDLLPWFEASARGNLSQLPACVPFHSESAVFVVAAAQGYPDQPEKGKSIRFLDSADSADYFMAGVSAQDGKLLTSGGRVLGALGMGGSLDLARGNAYDKLKKVTFEGMRFRTDIGHSQLKGLPT